MEFYTALRNDELDVHPTAWMKRKVLSRENSKRDLKYSAFPVLLRYE